MTIQKNPIREKSEPGIVLIVGPRGKITLSVPSSLEAWAYFEILRSVPEPAITARSFRRVFASCKDDAPHVDVKVMDDDNGEVFLYVPEHLEDWAQNDILETVDNERRIRR